MHTEVKCGQNSHSLDPPIPSLPKFTTQIYKDEEQSAFNAQVTLMLLQKTKSGHKKKKVCYPWHHATKRTKDETQKGIKSTQNLDSHTKLVEIKKYANQITLITSTFA